jgi:putative endonuclease
MRFGLDAEQRACDWLSAAGYRILDRNWRRPWGELDIVADNQGVVCFIEVKASSKRVGGFEPVLRADARKMHKVMRTAQTWLAQHRYGSDTEWRMDVISVIMNGNEAEIEHIPNI